MKSIAQIFKQSSGPVDTVMDEIRKVSEFTTHETLPDVSMLSEFDGIKPELLYPTYKATEPFSELTAIVQYTSDVHYLQAPDSPVFDQIGVIEMSHLDWIGGAIGNLGGNVNQPYTNQAVAGYKNRQQILQNAINGEEATIAYYTNLIARLKSFPMSRSRNILLDGYKILREEEIIHRKKFQDMYKKI